VAIWDDLAKTEDAAAMNPIDSALRTVERERAGLADLAAALSGPMAGAFEAAVSRIREATGRVIVTGLGKSGHVARKIAATLASTGTAAYFVHPAEASHGDLGMIAVNNDVVLALSWSGETTELRNIVEYSRRFDIPLIAITANAGSALGRASDIVLTLPNAEEACPHGLAPTTSTTMQLALGDALAVALLESRGFTAEDFHAFHPGGRLGASLHMVGDIMHKAETMPLCPDMASMQQAILVMSEKGFGCVGVVDSDGRLAGIVTDGDLRRHMGDGLLSRRVGEVMTRAPLTIGPTTLVAEALAVMNDPKRPITVLFVVEHGRPVGLVHMHDVLRIGAA
jgi:arabinose-5-phosphate isomerase